MRKKIEELARGKFECTKQKISFSEEVVEFSVFEGAEYIGEFVILCESDADVSGLVYSTHSRMKCLTPKFECRQSDEVVVNSEEQTDCDSKKLKTAKIRYQFHSKGLEEGLVEKGRFVIICNQTEISLSFCASILKAYPKSSYGEIRNLGDFSILAKENREEAFRIFYHKLFERVMESEDIKVQMMYKGILGSRPSIQNMEEFLIGTGMKERVSVFVERQKYEFYEVKTDIKDVLEIQKDNWGFVEIRITSDADFICLEKEVITSDLFLGSVYPLEFYIDSSRMHDGKNYGKITVSSVYESCEIEVMASTEEKHGLPTIEQTYRLNKKKALSRIVELYIQYRLSQIVTGIWVKETVEILDSLSVIEPNEMMYPLMKAQCLILNKQRQDAEWILDDFKRKWTDRKSPTWGYYLYVRSLMEKEPIFIERFTSEIEEIFHQNRNSALLYWVLLHLKEECDNSAYKFKAVINCIKKGYSSPYFYIEAYYLIAQNPYFLSKLDEFEMKILRWAIRHNAMTKDIAFQIFSIIENKKEYSSVWYELLCVAYEANPDPKHVGIICGYLIKSQKYDSIYHHWYELGIELDQRITGLYEAYLLSMDESVIKPVPKVIRKYFKYECTVPYRKLAVLYNNIVVSKDIDMETYNEYKDTISKFAMEQILAGHMDDNLAVIYDDMLNEELINKDVAKSLAKIMFLCKLVVFDKRIKRAIIYQSQMQEPQIISITNQSAYFQLVSKDYVILFEDENGLRYAGGISYQLQNLMDSYKYMEKCMSFAPQEMVYVLSYFDRKFDVKQSDFAFLEQNEPYVQKIMSSDNVSASYKATMLPKVLQFYKKQGDMVQLLEYLKKTDYAKLRQEDRKFAIELLIEYGFYQKAYEKAQEYGIEQLDALTKKELATYIIEKKKTADEFLIKLAAEAFRLEQYDRVIVSYLIEHYSAPTDEMLSLWNAGSCFAIKRDALSERLLTQMIYTGRELKESMPIFISYYEAKGKDSILLAYLSLCAYRYFVEQKKVDTIIFTFLEARKENHCRTNDVCNLALLHYYSKCKELTLQQIKIADGILAEYTARNMYFAFYKNLDSKLLQKYHLHDKAFLEYRTNPNHSVEVHYTKEADASKLIGEEMEHMYEGIFVKSFDMFFGEMILYYIGEETPNGAKIVENGRLTMYEAYEEEEKSRYSLLNQMLVSNTLQDDGDLYQSMKRYLEYEEITKAVFRIL